MLRTSFFLGFEKRDRSMNIRFQSYCMACLALGAIGLTSVAHAQQPVAAEKSAAPTSISAPGLPEFLSAVDDKTDAAPTDAGNAATESETASATESAPSEAETKAKSDAPADQADSTPKETTAKKTESPVETVTMKQWTDLQADLQDLRSTIANLNRKIDGLQQQNADLVQLRDQIKALESANQNLRDELDTLSTNDPTATLLTDAKQRMQLRRALKVSAEVRLYNWTEKSARMNVNGTWHELKPGLNTVAVPYGPVTMHRWTAGTPRSFDQWKEDEDTPFMAFDVGLPPSK